MNGNLNAVQLHVILLNSTCAIALSPSNFIYLKKLEMIENKVQGYEQFQKSSDNVRK